MPGLHCPIVSYGAVKGNSHISMEPKVSFCISHLSLVIEVKGNIRSLDLFAWPLAHLLKKTQALPRLLF